MPNPSSRGPWETAAPPAADAAPYEAKRPVLLHAVIQPNRAQYRWPTVIVVVAAIVAAGLSLPFLIQGEPIVAVLFIVEFTALAIAARAYRRWAAERSEELNLFADRLEITTRIGDRVTVDRLPTAWLKIEPVCHDRPAGPGFVVCASHRRIRVGGWLGPVQSQDLQQTLEAALALARRGGGLAASSAPTCVWSSHNLRKAPVDPALWAGGSGQS